MTEEELAALAAKEAEEAKAKEAEEAARLKAEEDAKKKSDEKNKPSDVEAKLIKELMKLKEKAKAEEARAKELESKLSGIDLDAAKEALKKLEEAENKELERKGDYERLLAKQKEAAEKEKEAINAKLQEAIKEREDLIRRTNDLSLTNAFSSSKFIQEKLALTPNKTRALYADHFEIVDGKLVAYDKPKGAPSRTQIIDASGEAVSFDAAIEQIINADPDKDYLIKSDQKAGAGSKGTVIDPTLAKKEHKDSLQKMAEGLLNPKNFGNYR